jgi:hypothetical protein
MVNKFDELARDKEVENIERPIPAELIESVCDIAKTTATKICGTLKMDPGTKISTILSSEKATGMVVEWNSIADLFSSIISLVDNPGMNYRQEIIHHVKNTIENIKTVPFKLRSLRLMLITETSSMANLIPQVKNIGKDKK